MQWLKKKSIRHAFTPVVQSKCPPPSVVFQKYLDSDYFFVGGALQGESLSLQDEPFNGLLPGRPWKAAPTS
jgi:hypothetical protein